MPSPPPEPATPCHLGLVFALGIESGCFEDLLDGVVTIRGRRFLAREGGLHGQRVVLVIAGAGRENARNAAELLIDGHRPRRIISAGFAGALSPELKRHDILVADRVRDIASPGGTAPSVHAAGGQTFHATGGQTFHAAGGQTFLSVPKSCEMRDRQVQDRQECLSSGNEECGPDRQECLSSGNEECGPDRQECLSSGNEKCGPGVHRGLLLTTDRIVRLPGEKQSLLNRYGAAAVDMETFAVAEVCRRRNVAFSSVRAITDTAEESLPPDMECILAQKTGAARLGAAIGAIWRRPASLKDMYRLRENALIASRRLAHFLAEIDWGAENMPTAAVGMAPNAPRQD